MLKVIAASRDEPRGSLCLQSALGQYGIFEALLRRAHFGGVSNSFKPCCTAKS